MIGAIVGNYKIVRVISTEGGMGILYEGEHIRLHSAVAIKQLRPELTQAPAFRERFHDEALRQALVAHAKIVRALDYIEQDGDFFFVMEYIQGQDLEKIIQNQGRLPEAQALDIFEDVLDGLGFAHKKNLIHRDVKSSNILVDETVNAKISDFGIALMVGGRRITTGTGRIIGTPCYMSPEQIQRPLEIDARSDIYSAGIVLYEMLIGDVPFDGETDFVIQQQHINAPRPDPCTTNPKICHQLCEIVLKAIEINPSKRFQSCEEFLADIKAYRQLVPPPPPPPPIWPYAVAGTAVLIILLVAGYLYLLPPQPAPQPPPQPVVVIDPEIAFRLIQRASESAARVCQEFQAIENKRIGIPIAKTTDPEVAKNLQRQIDEKEQNIQDLLARYKESIARLAQLDKKVVEDQFNRYGGSLTGDQKYYQIPYAQLTLEHYRNYQSKADVNVTITQETCKAK